MGVVEDNWREGRCRIEVGIFFANDEFIPLSGSSESGYRSGDRQSVGILTERDPLNWFEFDESASAISGEYHVSVGSGSYEAEGYIYLKKADTLLWMMHFDDSENFTEVDFRDGQIVAASQEYPVRYEWTIPIENPQQFALRLNKIR